jgi:uncharacterized membrane protein YqiK
MVLSSLFAVAILFMLSPVILSAVGFSAGVFVTLVLEALGIAILVFTAYLTMYRKFFVIAEANQAIIRTGGLGGAATAAPEVAIGKGIWVVPMLHKMQMLRFEQYVLTVQRQEKQALLCQDCLLADVSITFKISIPQTREDVLKFLAAAGTRPLNDQKTIEVLCGDSLETALRDAATSRSYQELFDGRDEVGKAIEDSLSNDLPKIGLQLSSAKLTDVQPTDLEFYDQNNPQHAVGLTKIVHITQDQNLRTKEKQLSTSEAIRLKEVETQKKILAMNQDEEFARSSQEKEIAVRKSTDKRNAEEASIAQREAVERRQIEMDRAVAVERILQEQATREAQVARDRSVEQADIEKVKAIQKAKKDQEIELVDKEREKLIAEEQQRIALVEKAKEREAAERDKEIVLTKKEAEKALAEKERQEAEAAAEAARQKVAAVVTVETAERVKRELVISQEAEAEAEMIKRQKNAEAEAYVKQKNAEAEAYAKQKTADAEAYKIQRDAEARQTAAEADYDAKVKAAKAEQEAAEARAAGERAAAMIPVDVARAQVEVEREKVSVDNERITVMERELKAKSQYDAAGIQLELQKLRIQKDAEVRIAMAAAVAQLTTNVKANIYGDASTLEAVTAGIANSFGIASFVQGLEDQVPEQVKTLAVGAVEKIVEGIAEALNNLGKAPDMKTIEEVVKKALAEHEAGDRRTG